MNAKGSTSFILRIENYLLFVVPIALVIIVLVLVVVGKFSVYGFGHLSILVLYAASRSWVLFTPGEPSSTATNDTTFFWLILFFSVPFPDSFFFLFFPPIYHRAKLADRWYVANIAIFIYRSSIVLKASTILLLFFISVALRFNFLPHSSMP